MHKKNIAELALIFCWAVLFFFFISIAMRFFTRQILVKKFHWDNAFTQIVFWGNEELNLANEEPDFTDNNDEVSLSIDWANEYPFHNSHSYLNIETATSKFNSFQNFVFNITDNVKSYTSDLLIGQYEASNIAKAYNRLIGCAIMPATSSNHSIQLQNGYLTYEQNLISDKDINELADSVQSFSTYLYNQGIDFVYMNTGSKVCPIDKQLPPMANEYTNENGDNLLRELNNRNVRTLDFREHMIQSGRDWYQSYYITDHHWNTATALWAAGVMSQYLNDYCGFNFDKKYFDPSQYDIETYPDYFLGRQGWSEILPDSGLESYDKILPKFNTSFSLQIPTRGIDLQGSYQDVLFDQQYFDQISEYSKTDFTKKPNTYSSIRLGNDAYSEIKNLAPEHNKDKKILLIYDSFGWYLSSYLATDVSEIATLYLPTFNGSVRSLVNTIKPDAVIMVYCEKNIVPIQDWNSHTDFFDLR